MITSEDVGGGGFSYISPSVGNFVMLEGQTANEVRDAQLVLQGIASGNINVNSVPTSVIENIKYYFPTTLSSIVASKYGASLSTENIQNMDSAQLHLLLSNITSKNSNNSTMMYILIGAVVGVVLLFLLLRR